MDFRFPLRSGPSSFAWQACPEKSTAGKANLPSGVDALGGKSRFRHAVSRTGPLIFSLNPLHMNGRRLREEQPGKQSIRRFNEVREAYCR